MKRCSALLPSHFPGTGREWPTFPEKRDQHLSGLAAWIFWQVAHILLAVLFGLDLSLIPAGMTGNTKCCTQVHAWLHKPTASTTTRYRGPRRMLNPKEITLTQPLVASQPQEGQPSAQQPSLCLAGAGERAEQQGFT